MRALVLSGGGSKGSFQYNVLKKLQKENPGLDYDIYAGISVGALNASLLATGPLKETLPQLEDVWLNDIKGSTSVRTHRFLKLIFIILLSILISISAGFSLLIFSLPKWIGLLFFGLSVLEIGALVLVPFIKSLPLNRSIYNTAPLRKIVKRRLNIERLKSSGKKLIIGAVSFQTGEYKTANEQSDNIIDWVIASSAFPIFFPMPVIDGQNWTDGGVRETVPLHDAIELGATEIDVILTSPLTHKKIGDNRILPQISRTLDLMTTEIMTNDLLHDSVVHAKGVRIRIFAPKDHFHVDPLAFDPVQIRKMASAEYVVIKDSHEIV